MRLCSDYDGALLCRHLSLLDILLLLAFAQKEANGHNDKEDNNRNNRVCDVSSCRDDAKMQHQAK